MIKSSLIMIRYVVWKPCSLDIVSYQCYFVDWKKYILQLDLPELVILKTQDPIKKPSVVLRQV